MVQMTFCGLESNIPILLCHRRHPSSSPDVEDEVKEPLVFQPQHTVCRRSRNLSCVATITRRKRTAYSQIHGSQSTSGAVKRLETGGL